MIDPDVFTAEMEVLCERFNRQISDPMFSRYYAYLSEKLSTREFQAAAAAIFNEERFFPAPVEFVNKVHGDIETLAEREWAAILEGIRNDARSNITDAARKALEEVGGTWGVRMAEGKEIGIKRAQFIKAYKFLREPPLAHRQALTSGKTALALGAGDD